MLASFTTSEGVIPKTGEIVSLRDVLGIGPFLNAVDVDDPTALRVALAEDGLQRRCWGFFVARVVAGAFAGAAVHSHF